MERSYVLFLTGVYNWQTNTNTCWQMLHVTPFATYGGGGDNHIYRSYNNTPEGVQIMYMINNSHEMNSESQWEMSLNL